MLFYNIILKLIDCIDKSLLLLLDTQLVSHI